ncbi:MAG: hypothetical protein EU539_13035, partial [Promethearchaeota archaeon]
MSPTAEFISKSLNHVPKTNVFLNHTKISIMLSKDKQLRPLIIDIGSNTFKMGWAGEDGPVISVPSVYVDVKDYLFDLKVIKGFEELFFEKETDNHLYGQEAFKYQNILKIHEFKKENNFNILSKFFQYYYDKL